MRNALAYLVTVVAARCRARHAHHRRPRCRCDHFRCRPPPGAPRHTI